MKKLFVSVPMKGRTEEEIKASIQKMKKIAEIYELIVILRTIRPKEITKQYSILEKALRNWHKQMYLLAFVNFMTGTDARLKEA